MSISQDVFSFIDALPEAMFIVDQKKRTLVGSNAAFSELTGLTVDTFLGTQIFDLPFSSREAKRGILRLFIKVSRDAGYDKPYSFTYVCPKGNIRNIQASARVPVLGGQKYVVFCLKQDQSQEVLLDGLDSWKFYLAMAYESFMEFRPAIPVAVVDEPDGRMDFLQKLGNSLQVKFFNDSAAEFYNDPRGTLEGRTFLSLFNKENDAIGFLDMLAVVGRIKSETAVSTNKVPRVHVEMSCVVKFNDEGNITALYCSHRDLSKERRFRDIIGSNKLEMSFMFHQSFVGFALLAPPYPLERPSIENLDAKLDEMLDQITAIRGNETMIGMHASDKSGFFMKPMRGFFYDSVEARQVLKELFVMRETSLGKPKETGNENDLEQISIFRGMFDNADRLNGVFIATSKHRCGYHPRHITGAG